MTTTSGPSKRSVRSPGSPRGQRQTADERRDAIVAAATEEFATGGLVGASTEAIAPRVGVSQPYVFQLFGTKKELFLAVVREEFGFLHRRVREVSGAGAKDLHQFFAEGMLLNLGAAVGLPGEAATWTLEALEGGA